MKTELYFLRYLFKLKLFELETYTCLHYLVLNFYQINKDNEIWTRDHLIINVLILYIKKINSI
jgi:hypothetical protein